MSRFKNWVRPHLLSLKPYSSARDEYSGKDGIFLDANENAFGSAGGNNWNRYPDPYQQELKHKIGQLKGISPNQLFLGNGSDEPIDLLIRAFCTPGVDRIGTFAPTYGMYSVSAHIHEIEVVEFPLDSNFQFDPNKISSDQLSGIKLFFICSPNNPSGNLLSRSAIFHLLEILDCMVIIDEAYIDFCRDQTFADELNNYENLIILQTFSKAWGMAGFRLGMAFGHPEVISLLNKIKAPYNLNGPIQELALTALEQSDRVDEWIAEIKQERIHLEIQLEGMSIVEKVYPSDANFLLVRFQNSSKVFQFLLSRQIIVRDRSNVPGCQNCLRLTVGKPDENQQLLSTLEEYIKSEKA